MAILDIKEDNPGRSIDQSIEKGVIKNDYTRTLWVRVDDPRMSQVDILSDIRIPKILVDTFPSDPFSRVVKRTARHTSPFRWDVEISYSNQWWDLARSNPNPLLRPVTFTRSTRDFQRPCDVDLTRTTVYPDGQSCRNSSSEPFDPPIVSDCAALTITATKNYEFFDEVWLDFLDPKAVNNAAFLGYAPGTVKIQSIRGSDVLNENDVSYEQVVFEFHVRKDGWEEKPLDQGYSVLIPALPGIIRTRAILDGTAVVSRPRLLDGSGAQLPRGGKPVFLDGSVRSGVTLAGPFVNQPRKDFRDFGLF